MATKDELGYRYPANFSHNFTFIGKNNKITGTLNAEASAEDIDLMLKRAIASFYGIYVIKEKDKFLFRDNQSIVIDLKDYFYSEDSQETEFLIRNSTNTNITSAKITDGKLILDKTSINGYTDLNIIAKVPDSDIYVQTTIQVINPTSIYEDFEIDKLEDSSINWTHIGDADWYITDSGSYLNSKSLRSGRIAPYQSSGIGLDLDLTEPGILIFAYKTSTRPYFDKLHFSIDGLDISEMESSSLWSGINDWRVLSYSIRAGVRNIKWEYIKGPYEPYNDDIVWIDLVVIPDKFNDNLTDITINDTDLAFTAYPNPFNPVTEIKFNLESKTDVQLTVFDIKGRLVANLFEGNLEKGNQSFQFDGSKLSSGMYYSVLKYNNKILSKKLILTK